eukprot:m.1021064 g.1021064  ORF g.1021064 m.1021064 type:complete len:404 (-) comp24094_c0_seq16:2409-3620(-)
MYHKTALLLSMAGIMIAIVMYGTLHYHVHTKISNSGMLAGISQSQDILNTDTSNHHSSSAELSQPRHVVLCKQQPDALAQTFSPRIIFIAGLEGSGHHGFVPMFRDMNATVFIRRAEQILTDFWDPTLSIAHRLTLRTRLLEILQDAFNDCVATAATSPAQSCSHFVLFGAANFFSYPYDSPRNPLRHPDLLELINILEDPSLTVRFDLKILVLHRQPFSTVQSNFRRRFLTAEKCLQEAIRGKRVQYKGPCDALLYLAREAEMHVTFLSAELSAISAEYFRVIDFAHFVNSTDEYLGLLTRFLEFRPDQALELSAEVSKRFKGHVRRPKAAQDLHMGHLKFLFSGERLLRWQLLDSGRYDIRTLDTLHGTGADTLGYTCYARFSDTTAVSNASARQLVLPNK